MFSDSLYSGVASRLPGLLGLRRSFTGRVFRITAAISLATLLAYVAGHTVNFIVQLFEVSSSEILKFAKVIAALLNRPTLDLEFLPQEFEDLTPNEEGVYAYAPGGFHPFLFRRSESEPGAWEWSDDGGHWLSTDSFRESPNGVPEPPVLIFILRLQVEHLLRRRLANPVAQHRRLPPPLSLEGVSSGHLEEAPDVLCCPISHHVMRLPVVAPSGTTFEYECIRSWSLQHNTDPVNGAPLTEGDLYPNLALRDMTERWLKQGRDTGAQEGGGGGGDARAQPGAGAETEDAEGGAEGEAVGPEGAAASSSLPSSMGRCATCAGAGVSGAHVINLRSPAP